MVQPITWQTVNGPSLAEASRPMEAASRSFNEAFGGLDNVLKQRQAIETGNWDQTKLNNTNALLGAVQEAKTPEEFASREAVLRQQLAGYGAQVDPVAVRAAMDGRMATLQQRAVAGMDYQNKVTDNREAPIRDSIASLTSQGRFPEAKALLEQHTLRNEAALYDANRQGERRVLTEKQADTTFGNNQESFGQTKKLWPGQVALQQAQINQANAVSAASRAASSERALGTGLDKLMVGYQQDYTAKQAEYLQGVGQLASALKIPLNKAGEPQLEGVDLDTVKILRAQAKEKLGDPPSSSAYLADFDKRVVQAGVPLKDQLNARKLLGEVFNDGSVVSPEHVATLKAGGEAIDKRIEALRKNNIFVNTPEELLKGQDKVMKEVNSGISDSDGTKDRLKAKLNTWMTEGIEIPGKDGKSVKVKVPPDLISAGFAMGVEKDAFFAFRNLTDDNIEKFVREKLASPEYQAMRAEAASIGSDPTGALAKRALVESLRNQAGVQGSPRGLLNNLDAAIAAKEKKTLK